MRYGLGWRTELGAAILANAGEIDVIEVMAEDFFEATRAQRRALRFLGEHFAVVLHATSLGLASTEPVEGRRLEAVARVIGWLEPDFWSEHLAFVRGGGYEVGHLAAPPRNEATLAGLVCNVEAARRATGTLPLLENVASLIEPPFCSYDERGWLHAVLAATSCDLLLDLHNLHANAVNFGFEARAVVRSLPAERVRAIHLAGGRRIERGRLLDDHRHPVPDEVFALLEEVQSDEATVILERDGEYPAIEVLLAELGRARGVARAKRGAVVVEVPERIDSGAPDVIARLAKLYVDASARAEFLADPDFALDRDDLLLSARSFESKRRPARAGVPRASR